MPIEITGRDPIKVVTRDLREEFGGVPPEEAILVIAEEEVAIFETATIREFVSILAWRRARLRAQRLVAHRNREVPRSATHPIGD